MTTVCENTKESLSWVCDKIMDQLQAQFDKDAYTAPIRTHSDETGMYLDDDDCDAFRETFVRDYKAEELLRDLMADQDFIDALNDVIENFANEADFDIDAGDGCEPDWDNMIKERLEYEDNN